VTKFFIFINTLNILQAAVTGAALESRLINVNQSNNPGNYGWAINFLVNIWYISALEQNYLNLVEECCTKPGTNMQTLKTA